MTLANRGRACGLFVLAALLCSSTGCTHFQAMCTDKWFEGNWLPAGHEEPVNHVLTYWENDVRITQDYVNKGAKLPGLVGRLYLFNDDTQGSVEARGAVVVQMLDMTNAGPNTPPVKEAEWHFDPESLKGLKKKDRIGDGYTLFLPWEKYRPEVKQVQLQICYVPRNGVPRYTDPQNIALQGPDHPPMKLTQRREVPALDQLRAKQAKESVPVGIQTVPEQQQIPVPQSQGQTVTPVSIPQPQNQSLAPVNIPQPQPTTSTQPRGMYIVPIGPPPATGKN